MTVVLDTLTPQPPHGKTALTPQPPLRPSGSASAEAGEGEPEWPPRPNNGEPEGRVPNPRPLAGEGGTQCRVRASEGQARGNRARAARAAQPFVKTILALALLLLALPSSAQKPLVVGSKRFTESYILGEIVRQVADTAHEGMATHKQGLGNTGIVFAALKNGSIDIYPEYTGTVAQDLLHEKTTGTIDQLSAQLAPQGLGVAIPLGFNDTYALAMREDMARRLNIRTLSDLAQHPDLKLGLSQEFIGRADGWRGLVKAYALPFQTPQGFDHGTAYKAIAGGTVDVVDVYSTDAEIAQDKLRVLADNRHYFPAYDAVLVYRTEMPRRLPRTWAALEQLRNSIPAARMIAMNAQAQAKHQSFAAIAHGFVTQDLRLRDTSEVDTQSRGFWGQVFGGDFWLLTRQHLFLVFVSLALSILVGVPLGIWAARSRPAAPPILSAVGLIQTIPSLALLAFLIPLLGQIGTVPTLIALFLYSLLPIVRNTYTGLTDIAPSLRESAVALGLPAGARLRLIELPLTARSILAGIKTSAVINVGTATIAAFIGAGGYGERINIGLTNYDNATLLAGAIPAALLALLVQFAFEGLDRVVVSAGLRRPA